MGLALLAWWWPRWRYHRVVSAPCPVEWVGWLEGHFAFYHCLDEQEQRQLRRLMQGFLWHKRFFGCGGLVIDEPMRLAVAAQAALLQLHRWRQPEPIYPQLRYILIYPDAFLTPRVEYRDGGVEVHHEADLEGESWDSGKVILSWADIERDLAAPDDAYNVVLHEFAHQLDEESGSADGVPLLPNDAARRHWQAAMQPVFQRLIAIAEVEELSDAMSEAETAAEPAESVAPFTLDPYGATSPAEFFAVATEAFMEAPWALAAAEPAVFAELQAFYQLDPRRWFEPLGPQQA